MNTLEKAAKKLEGTDISFDDALDQIMSLGTESERSAKAAEVFGESVAYRMTPLLNAGAEGLSAMKEEANSLGIVMSQESVTSGAAMNDMFSKLDATFSQVKNTIMVDLMPYVMEILDWLVQNLPLVDETVKKVIDKIMPIIKPVLDAVLNAFKAVFSLLNGDWEGFIDGVKDLWDSLCEWMNNLSDIFLEIGKNLFTAIWDGIKGVWDGISGWVSDKVGWLADKLSFWDNGTKQMSTVGSAYTAPTSSIVRGNSGAGSNQPISLSVELDGKTLARTTYSYNKEEANRRGRSLVTG